MPETEVQTEAEKQAEQDRQIMRNVWNAIGDLATIFGGRCIIEFDVTNYVLRLKNVYNPKIDTIDESGTETETGTISLLESKKKLNYLG